MKIRLQDVVRTGILAALAVALQAMTLPQPVTGPGINAVLFVASLYVGPLAGVCVGISWLVKNQDLPAPDQRCA
jgi:uncharacterized membrane protein